MKWIIYWLTLMISLPLFYLFWLKKSWRLFLGIIILVVLIIGLVSSSKIAYSILERELKGWERKIYKEGWAETGTDKERRRWQTLEKALKNTSRQKITPENKRKNCFRKRDN